MVLEIGIPPSISWGVWFDGKGVCLILRKGVGKIYKRAFRVTRDPTLDAQACETFAVWAEDIVEEITGDKSLKKSDIWTPLTN